MEKIVFCGGGTAGHVMPNIALIEKLKDCVEIHYIGGSGIEKDIVLKYPYIKYHEIRTTKLIRKFTLKNLCIPFELIKAVKDAKKVLNDVKPKVIFSKGGFVSVPVVLAHGKIPVLGHESDYTMGLANKIIYPRCKKMFFSFKTTANKYNKKGVYSGTPIREEIFNRNKTKLLNSLKTNNGLKNILVVGGSTGAKKINEVIEASLDKLTKHYNVFHITGKNKNNATTHKNYYQFEYVENMGDFLSASDIIISRAGSNAIFEFLALKKRMILIPLPLDQSRGDQILNARYFKQNNWAEVIPQEKLNTDTLLEAVQKISQHKVKLTNTPKDNAVRIIVDEIRTYIQDTSK